MVRRLADVWIVVGIAASVVWALELAQSVPRGDDLTYIDWARGHGSPFAAFASPPDFPGVRFLNSMCWQLGVALSGSKATLTAGTEAGLWLAALVTWTGWAQARGGRVAAAWMLAFMLCCPWFRDLPTWRSWMTSTGSCAFLGAGLLALETKHPWWALLAGLLAVGFKENAGLVLAAAAALVYGHRLHGATLLGLLVPGLLAFGRGASVFWPADPLAHTLFYVHAVGSSHWLPAIAFGALQPWMALLGVVARWFPTVIGVAAILGATWVGGRARSWWAPVVAVSVVLPLCYSTENPVYLLEGALVVMALAATALARADVPVWVGALALVTSLPTLRASRENLVWQRDQWEIAQRILRERSAVEGGTFHLAADAHDACRFVAFWLERERGWTAVDTVGSVELCHGLSTSEQ